MRQIKFRGKDIETGEWIYGSLVQPIGQNPRVYVQDVKTEGVVSFFAYDVEESTVGQYVGWQDKNEVDIYEGDVLYFTIFDDNDHDTQHKGVVNYDISTCYVECSEDEAYDLDWVAAQDCEIEVIGNIHDNPKILKNE